MKTSIILPTLNESHNIIKLLEEILKCLSGPSECIVVDDNSPDGTGKKIKQLFQGNPRVRCYIRTKERGLGTAIGYGLLKAKGEKIVIMDSDFNHQPQYLLEFLQLLDKYDLVCGSRYLKGGGMPETPLRFWGSYFFNLYIRFLLNIKIKDSLSGFVGIKKSTLNFLSEKQKKTIFKGFGEWYIHLLWWAKKEKLKIKEISIQYGSRLGDKSKMDFRKSIIDYTKTVFWLRIKGL